MTPIVFIPGIGADARMFEPVMMRLEPAFECIGWDLPGYGKTPLRGAYGFADLARWLADDLDGLGHDTAHVLGHSIGGMAALEFAHSFPERLEGLILSGTTPAFGSRDGTFAAKFLADRLGPLDAGATMADLARLLIVYTSGTTGQPKGTVLSQAAVACNALNSIHMHGLRARDHVLTVLPMFHVGGLNIQTLPALSCGATVTLHARFDAGATLGAIAADRPTLTLLVPATMQAMIGHPAWATTDLSSLRAVATGSTDVPVPLIEAFHARGVPVIQVYGSTETGPVCLYQQTAEAFETVGSIGRAGRHSDIRLIDEAGREVADGTPGEILVRGGNVAEGYWRQPELTAAAFRDGWYHSGDVALRDERGLYWFKDRIKNVIISGGENIYPAELERILHGLPGIAEAAVVGRRDQRWGEVPVAVVALSDKTRGPHARGDPGRLRGPDRALQGAQGRALRRRPATQRHGQDRGGWREARPSRSPRCEPAPPSGRAAISRSP
jgi:acyl-CoA synthetase (AMP-forming)/AMP-acid ligase II